LSEWTTKDRREKGEEEKKWKKKEKQSVWTECHGSTFFS